MAQFVTKKGLLSWRLLFIGALFLLQNWAVAALGKPHVISGHAAASSRLAVAISFAPPRINQALTTTESNESIEAAALEPTLKPSPNVVAEKAPQSAVFQPSAELTKPTLTKTKVAASTKTTLAVTKASPPSAKAAQAKPVELSSQQPVALAESNERQPKTAPVNKRSVASSVDSHTAANPNSSPIAHQAGLVGKHEPIITEPVFAAQPMPPRYPSVARKRGQEGTVWLDIWLDEKGQKSKLEVSESSGLALLDASALKAVSGWQFKPYEENGIRTASRVRIPVVFSLN
ncbi:energy transducer TonB [Amphritea sp. 2_MG-2023]|uniref:energy transducer TonB n=1 Tax=Amphritea TaxID=515417 RepID=UPI001C07D4DE|nr:MULTISPECIES: energy transducer TonB [Amphritea]MBU2964266.1 energy transducer TonB [Amphritea atlantica]MDO6419476.1 energy transducer TonB [Amphritea sp. 2_MG-2023]